MSGTKGRIGRLKRFVGLSHDSLPAYRCRGCCTSFELQYHVCPDCGGYSVERVRE
jgi:rRNA maturation endonuclease Nob1